MALDHTFVPNNSQIIHIYFIACMSLKYDGNPIKDMPSLLYSILDQTWVLYLCWVAMLVAYTWILVRDT